MQSVLGPGSPASSLGSGVARPLPLGNRMGTWAEPSSVTRGTRFSLAGFYPSPLACFPVCKPWACGSSIPTQAGTQPLMTS